MIKKHPSNNNRYLRTQGGIWVRDPFTERAGPRDINTLTTRADASVLVQNEVKNLSLCRPSFTAENWEVPQAVIVGDGMNVRRKLRLLRTVPRGVKVIAVNDALNEWDVRVAQTSPDLYVVNNPYRAVMDYMPRAGRPQPRCLASVRTYSEFVAKYPGPVWLYAPAPTAEMGGRATDLGVLDDYRNPVAAAVSFAVSQGCKAILLVGCDASFAEDRPGSEKLPNGAYQYPAFRQAHAMLDGMFYWLGQNKVRVGDASAGPKFDHAAYIPDDQWGKFFAEDVTLEGRRIRARPERAVVQPERLQAVDGVSKTPDPRVRPQEPAGRGVR